MGLGCVNAAHAQKIRQAVSVAVVPFADRTGRSAETIATKATDAAALALDESQEYVVTTRADTNREMETLGIAQASSPATMASREQMVRLGERLQVDKVASGFVDRLTVDKSGRCRCVLTIRLLDIGTQEYLDGASADYTTRAIPGWQGDEAGVINEALRSAAEDCVRQIQTSRRPRGNVDIVDQSNEVIVNLGARDGIEIGVEMLVVRGIWNAAQDVMTLRKIGRIEVKEVEVNMCRCRSISGSVPRTGDKTYVMYRPTQRIQVAERKSRMKKYARWGVGVALLFAIWNTATGNDNQSPPGVNAFLAQATPGSEPRIGVAPRTGNTPDSGKVFGWLVFRGENQGFTAQVDNNNHLVAAVQGAKLANFEDDPSLSVDIAFDMEFTFLDEEGEQEDGDVSITYNHLPLTAGRTYYYKLRRIVDPGRVRIPIADTNQAPEPVDVDFDIDPEDSLGEASPPAGPITYFFPPQPEEPSNGNTTVDPRAGQTTFRWQPSVGADQYRVFIYNNAQAVGGPIKASGIISGTAADSTLQWTMNTTLQPDADYFWFVAARRSGERMPLVRSNGVKWVLSEPYRFRTILTPPAGPTSTAEGAKRRPVDRPGFFGERRIDR